MTKHIEGLLKVHPLKHGDQRYIVYCDYGFHQGIITTNEKFDDCRAKRCKHLHIYEVDYRYETNYR